MADAEESTASEIEFLRAELLELERELSSQLDANAGAAKPVALDQTAVGRLSRTDSMQCQALAQAARQATQIRLSRCKMALQAIERAG